MKIFEKSNVNLKIMNKPCLIISSPSSLVSLLPCPFKYTCIYKL